MKRQATDWEDIFVKHISDNGLASKIYKVPLKLNTYNTNADKDWNNKNSNSLLVGRQNDRATL